MTFDNKIDIANLIVQAFIGIVTFVTLLVALSQSNQSKRNREDDIKRYQSSRISAWYEGADANARTKAVSLFSTVAAYAIT